MPYELPAGMLLAAGAGSRFGSTKALIDLDGRYLVERGVDLLRSSGCSPCVVVLGAQASAVRAAADLSGADVVVADAWQRGQSASLDVGLGRLVAGPATAVLIALADQPLVTTGAMRRLIATWRDGATAVAATYAGRMRTPVLLDRTVWDEVRAGLSGDRGAGPWLRAHPERVTAVEIGDVADGIDIDTEGDLEVVRRRIRPL